MTLGPEDVALFGRLGRGETLNGEFDSASPEWRPLLKTLNNASPDDRPSAFDSAMRQLPKAQRDALRAAAMGCGPGAAPDHEGSAIEAMESWGPLRIGETPQAEPFPIDVFPPVVANLAAAGSKAIGCPLDFLAVPVLAVAGGAVGRSVSLLMKPGYFASSAVFAGCIGPPSDGKTPALSTVAKPLRRIDATLALEHEQAIERWKAECEQIGPDGKKARMPASPRPRPRRIDVDDATMEALPLILADNPRGLIMVRDELSALVLGLNQYKGGKGNDRAAVLKIWSGEAFKKDRVAHEDNAPIRCPHPCLSIIGCMTPDMLGELVDPKGRSDGFTDRFLFAYPDAAPLADWSDDGVPDDAADAWAGVVGRLWARPMNIVDGRYVPHVARMTPRAKDAWERRHNAITAEMNDPAFPPSMRGPWGKLREYAGRLALILCLMDHAADPTADPHSVPDVEERHVENAWKLIDYFKSHARRVYAALLQGAAGPEAVAAKAIVQWLKSAGRTTFSERDVKRARTWIEPEALTKALAHLVKLNAIRPREAEQPTAKGGRPASPEYTVNPALHA